jgi:hypothetical protein
MAARRVNSRLICGGKKALEETIWKDPGTNIALLPTARILVSLHKRNSSEQRLRMDVVRDGINTAPDVLHNLLGVVLNRVDFDHLKLYERTKAKYYFTHYGYTE